VRPAADSAAGHDCYPRFVRDTLEDLGGSLGVTDPATGPVVLAPNSSWLTEQTRNLNAR